jgi:hypothetical protein
MGRRATGDPSPSKCLRHSLRHKSLQNELPSIPLFHCQRPARLGIDLKGVMIAIDLDNNLP